MNATTDVVTIGGGLAGLCLALQLKQQDPDITVTVLERREHPVREAAFKVVEPTVEIGTHYFARVLGLREHLETGHIRRFGFRFFFSGGRHDIGHCTGVGVSQMLPAPSWQIDRGRFENFPDLRARAAGVEFLDATTARGIDLTGRDQETHRVRFQRGGGEHGLDNAWYAVSD